MDRLPDPARRSGSRAASLEDCRTCHPAVVQPQIHLIDETWIDAPVALVSAVVADPANWPGWWPTLDLTVTRDRRLKGMQWAARSGEPVTRRAGRLRGTVEIWLEPLAGGVILHHYLRLDPVDGRPLPARAANRLTRRYAWHAKRVFWRLKDQLEAGPASGPGRPAGPRSDAANSAVT